MIALFLVQLKCFVELVVIACAAFCDRTRALSVSPLFHQEMPAQLCEIASRSSLQSPER